MIIIRDIFALLPRSHRKPRRCHDWNIECLQVICFSQNDATFLKERCQCATAFKHTYIRTYKYTRNFACGCVFYESHLQSLFALNTKFITALTANCTKQKKKTTTKNYKKYHKRYNSMNAVTNSLTAINTNSNNSKHIGRICSALVVFTLH